ncbi:hypothetical protein [Ktedonosporobacter rubrisoli]|uniref:hypothetical protein n=1 Tax=Ktedonosporobacter rubrisoli TaxID=2509675 RepID=UPI003BF5193D
MPQLECDLVMKGGITSGIVYPPAVLELKKKYRFHSIGGTSAGALAAAGTAAAEYNRQSGGFEKMARASTQLAQGENLLDLFQAAPATQPLLDVIHAILGSGAGEQPSVGAPSVDPALLLEQELSRLPLLLRLLHWLFPLMSPYWLVIVGRVVSTWSRTYVPFQQGGSAGTKWGFFAGLGGGLILALVVSGLASLIGVGQSRSVFLPALLICCVLLGLLSAWLGCWLGRLILVTRDMYDLCLNRLPANNYGICNGHTSTRPGTSPDNTNLTDWLCAMLDHTAGLPEQRLPLTFGQLRSKQIELKMVTSNLSHHQPYILPEGLHNFLFNKHELLQMFPEYVVEHMVRAQPAPQSSGNGLVVPPEVLPSDYYFLPAADELPVAFATRLSLSFPFLISAVPLYTVSTEAAQRYAQGQHGQKLDPLRDLQKNWFSDGGLCSNFPIQFFDAWLPTRPTFGINLTSAKEAMNTSALEAIDHRSSAATRAQVEGKAVYLPGAEDLQAPEWEDLSTLFGFLGAIFGIAQSYHDTQQANLPSYRERIVQIRLNEDEGGANLLMPRVTINKVMEKGIEAGQLLTNPLTFSFEQHWWVRFLVLMAQLEENIDDLEGIDDPSLTARLQQEALSASTAAPLRYPYYRDRRWVNEAHARVQYLRNLMQHWQQANRRLGRGSFFGANAPQPDPSLRVTPRL